MNRNQLIDLMERAHVSLPEGTGNGGRILNKDLENALGDHHANSLCMDEASKQHLTMRRELEPMKAYRFTSLNESNKKALWTDQGWFAEEKYNGWRVMFTYVPGDGFEAWGGNISDVTFLPKNYTKHIMLDGLSLKNKRFGSVFSEPFVMDTECICTDPVENLDGIIAHDTLGAVDTILGSSPERAISLQLCARLRFKCFDMIPTTKRAAGYTAIARKTMLAALLSEEKLGQLECFEYVSSVYNNKKQFLNAIWRTGGEGVVLKNATQQYVPGGRLRTHAIKVKRTMSGEIGDDLDCFISGFKLTDEWSKQFLIGALELSVVLPTGEFHHIATVSGMPTHVRKMLTLGGKDICLSPDFYHAVLVVDGQELSARNKKLMHAKIDWGRGFRQDKGYRDCKFNLNILEEERF